MSNDTNKTKPIQEGYQKRGGVNPPPNQDKPNFTPPPQAPKKDKKDDT